MYFNMGSLKHLNILFFSISLSYLFFESFSEFFLFLLLKKGLKSDKNKSNLSYLSKPYISIKFRHKLCACLIVFIYFSIHLSIFVLIEKMFLVDFFIDESLEKWVFNISNMFFISCFKNFIVYCSLFSVVSIFILNNLVFLFFI